MPLWYTKNYTPTPHFPFESFLKDAEKILNDPFTQETASKYPLTNIGYSGNTLIFEIALAGFKKENITVSYVGNVITVVLTVVPVIPTTLSTFKRTLALKMFAESSIFLMSF